MSHFEHARPILPKKPVFITLLLAAVLDFIPLDDSLFFWLPEFSALILLYWALNRAEYIGTGCAFLLGLLIDVGTASLLGQHALSYTLMTFTVQHYQRQIMLNNYGIQSVAVWLALSGNLLLLGLIRFAADQRLPEMTVWISPVVGALLWPLLNKVMLAVLNSHYRRK